MTCIVNLYETPKLRDAVLIEGLPGIGLVANLVTSHLIKELNAKLFGEVFSSSFQDVVVTDPEGGFISPVNRFYYYKGENSERDLILLYGNTQALTTRGQYELCWQILETAEKLECKRVITLGGYRPGREVHEPKLYYAASDLETSREVKKLGIEILGGRILGVAGLLIGLCKLRKMRGFCLLAETPGNYADTVAAREVLTALTKMLGLNLNLDKEIAAIGEEQRIEPSELGTHIHKQGAPPEWFI